ncbi:MAG: outer membrane protein assembly factor BamD [Alphaproteobacteria bacterium]|nr:outer membrane protein assembly factor BamD [Alphaproteobacteria bacterium]
MAALAACSGPEEVVYTERPVEEIYNEAVDLVAENSMVAAALQFEEVERQHPYSVWATRAQLMAAYSYYRLARYDQAINSVNRFIELNPGHPDAPYAHYLKALSNYERISDVGRDQKITQNALADLQEVVQRFPDSEYARDARLKIDLTRNHLAGKEMEIGRFYQQRNEHLAAINRFRNVVETYETTDQVPEALHRLTESYYALGMTDEAQKTAAVLGYNYPGSDWYLDSYALFEGTEGSEPVEEEPWLRRLVNSLF